MTQGEQIIRSLEETLGRLAGLRTVLRLDALTPEALAAIPATQLPCAVLVIGPAALAGRWRGSGGEYALWDLPLTAGVLELLPAGSLAWDGLDHWSRRLVSVLEQDAGWTALVAEVRREGPPGVLRVGRAGCVHQALSLRHVCHFCHVCQGLPEMSGAF
ncbi:hypothetical protein [Megalodesulfovibrio paquesii]